MTTALDLFPSRVAFVDSQGRLTAEAVRALNAVFARIGGASGSSTGDLATALAEDSGLEELRSELYKSFDALASSPLPTFVHVEQLQNEISGLRDVVAELSKKFNDLQQGTIYDGNR